jgi:cyclopropane-fatty-acyl-phospholipid synthase
MKLHSAQTFPVATLSSSRAESASTAFDRFALRCIQRPFASAPIRFVLWDGWEAAGPADTPVATIVINNRPALFRWLWDPELNFGEAYMFGAVEVRGDLVRMLEEVYRAWPEVKRRDEGIGRRRDNDVRKARENVHHHYDLGNDFYRRWLDDQLLYTCAYFRDPASTLEEAQVAKMDLVCRKLCLRSGERVVEAGCGWGALAIFMARRYGVDVWAFNVSSEQIAYARERAAREGLSGRVHFIEDDYRNVEGRFDAFVSVGMLEHVGLSEFETLGGVIDRALTPEGRGLLHFIGRNQPMPLNAWIRRRIFPGAYPPTIAEVSQHVLEPQDFSMLDVENIRLHYAKTLEHWSERFNAKADEIEAMFDAPFVRAWRLYLAGSQAAFASGFMQLFQIVFARGHSNAIPWTRSI